MHVLDLPALKGYQSQAIEHVDNIRSARESDYGQSILLVAPPGAGKSRVMGELSHREVERGGRVVIKAHRRMLVDQLIDNFEAWGCQVGCVMAGYMENPEAPIQIVSTQTLFSRAVRKGSIDLPEATLVLDDEAHQQVGSMNRALMIGSVDDNGAVVNVRDGWLAQGADLVGFTATPAMKHRLYSHMVDMVSYSQLRKEKMHLPVMVIGPDEIDTRGLKANASGDYSEKELEKRVKQDVIFGSVYDHWKELNPSAYPAILFGPSVDAARWFAWQFMRKGVKVAHMDGDLILLPEGGKLVTYPSDMETRREVLRMSKEGEIALMTNRFLLREAIDMPWLYHMIGATVFGGLTTALQSVGRIQRYWPDYDKKLFQDHGGFVWRHGRPNADRQWRLGTTQLEIQRERVSKIQRGELKEEMRCAKCGCWRSGGAVCPNCHNACNYSVRAVRQVNGKLKLIKGQATPPLPVKGEMRKIVKDAIYSAIKSGKPTSSVVGMAYRAAAQQGIRLNWWSSELRDYRPPEKNTSAWHSKASEYYWWMVPKNDRKNKVSGA